MKDSTAKTLSQNSDEYQDLILRNNPMGLVYGPQDSRRFGFHLGINLLGTSHKVCSMNCAYCDLGATELRLNKIKSNAPFPSVSELTDAFQAGFNAAQSSSKKIETILVSGNGEPSLHPHLGEVLDSLKSIRNQVLPQAKIVFLTNGANLDSRKVIDALNRVDERILKIDAGNEAMFKTINSPLARTSLSSILSSARLLKGFVAQTLFVQGAVDNTAASDLEDWIEVIGLVRPKTVHIHTISRVPQGRGLKRVDEDTLYMIASKLERRTQIKSLIFT